MRGLRRSSESCKSSKPSASLWVLNMLKVIHSYHPVAFSRAENLTLFSSELGWPPVQQYLKGVLKARVTKERTFESHPIHLRSFASKFVRPLPCTHSPPRGESDLQPCMDHHNHKPRHNSSKDDHTHRRTDRRTDGRTDGQIR